MEKLENEMMSTILKLGKKKFLGEKKSDITQGELGILFFIYNNENLNPKKLTEIMHISKSMVTSLLNALEEKEFIKRNIDSLDKRKITLLLTQKGIDFINIEKKKIHIHIKEIIDKLGIEDSRKFIEIINKLLKEDKNDKII